jgi:hypothetical protein
MPTRNGHRDLVGRDSVPERLDVFDLVGDIEIIESGRRERDGVRHDGLNLAPNQRRARRPELRPDRAETGHRDSLDEAGNGAKNSKTVCASVDRSKPAINRHLKTGN